LDFAGFASSVSAVSAPAALALFAARLAALSAASAGWKTAANGTTLPDFWDLPAATASVLVTDSVTSSTAFKPPRTFFFGTLLGSGATSGAAARARGLRPGALVDALLGGVAEAAGFAAACLDVADFSTFA
jgi:hypothetical protein